MVVYLHLRSLPFAESMERMRNGVQASNAAHHDPEGPPSGQNETTTRAFFQIIAIVPKACDSILAPSNAEAFCDTHPQLQSRPILRLFHSPQRRMHPEANAIFVEPDLSRLPQWDE
jgi:hypothetical protein